MKKFIAITAALLISGATLEAHAQYSECQSAERLATVIMEARQNGVPMSGLMEIAGDNGLVQEMVLEAYRTPSYTTHSVQQRVIRDFADKYYRICVEVFRATE